MAICEFWHSCSLLSELEPVVPAMVLGYEENYCRSHCVQCARYMIYKAFGAEDMPPDILPGETERAGKIIKAGRKTRSGARKYFY